MPTYSDDWTGWGLVDRLELLIMFVSGFSLVQDVGNGLLLPRRVVWMGWMDGISSGENDLVDGLYLYHCINDQKY